MEKLRQIKKRHEKEWIALPGVEAVGIGLESGEAAIVITCQVLSADIRKRFPNEIDGIKIVLREGGPFAAQ